MILEISFYVHFPSVHLVSVNLQLLLLTASKLTMAILWPTVTLNMTSCNRLSDIRVVSFFFFLRILCSDDILSCFCSFSLWYYTWGSVYSSRWVLCSMWNSCKVTSGCLCLGSTLFHRGWSWMNLTVLWLFPKHHQLILRKTSKHVLSRSRSKFVRTFMVIRRWTLMTLVIFWGTHLWFWVRYLNN